MKNLKCLIIINGYELYVNYIKKYIFYNKPYIICVDGGLNLMIKFKIVPNILIGDFDSIKYNIIKKFNIYKIKLQKNKKFSDLKYAIDMAINLKFNNIIIMNATCGRLDHFFNNVFLLEYTYIKDIFCQIINSNNKIIYWDGSIITLNKSIYYKYFSIIPISENLKGVTLHGFKYNIINSTIYRYNIETISNEYKNKNNFLYFKEGKALIIFSKDKKYV